MMDWVWLGVALYLLLGLWLAFRGRLAFMVNTQGAMLETHGPIPQWKKVTFKFLLRLSTMLFYPVFLIWR
jgi:hypothetical protein